MRCDSCGAKVKAMLVDGQWECPVCGESSLDLGRCCVCEKTDPTVRNVLMMDYRAPVAGTGWGCALCGLEADGAIAVVCDKCLRGLDKNPVKFICDGYVVNGKRIAVSGFEKVFFDHDKQKHAWFENES